MNNHVSLNDDSERCTATFGRLVLAHLTHDKDAVTVVADELGECAGCWQAVAANAVCVLSHLLVSVYGEREAVAFAEDAISEALGTIAARDSQ